jgi:hypothetical protein
MMGAQSYIKLDRPDLYICVTGDLVTFEKDGAIIGNMEYNGRVKWFDSKPADRVCCRKFVKDLLNKKIQIVTSN